MSSSDRGIIGKTGVVRESTRTYWLARQGPDAGHLVSAFNKANGGIKGEHVGYRVETDEAVVNPRNIRKDVLYYTPGKTGEVISVGWVEAHRSPPSIGAAKTCSKKKKSACKRARHCDWEVGEGCSNKPGAEGAVKGAPGRKEFVSAVLSGNSPLPPAKTRRTTSSGKKAAAAEKKTPAAAKAPAPKRVTSVKKAMAVARRASAAKKAAAASPKKAPAAKAPKVAAAKKAAAPPVVDAASATTFRRSPRLRAAAAARGM